MKRLQKLIAALSAVVVIAILVVGIIAPMLSTKEVVMTAFQPGAKPEGEKLNLTMPDADDQEAIIAFAVELYEIASEKYCTAENAAYMVTFSNTMLGVPVTGQRYDVRNGDKEYYTEFSFIEGDTGFLGAIMGAVAPDSTRFAEVRYTDASMDYINSYKMYTTSDKGAPSYTKDEKGNFVYDVDWSTAATAQKPKHDYGYRLTEQDITLETVTEAKVSYNEEEGYYTLELTLDPVKASEAITIHNLKANMEDAEYTAMVQKIEIWDNGYPRYFHALDTWEGMGGFMESVLDFRTTYYFEEYWCDINNYQFMVEYGKVTE